MIESKYLKNDVRNIEKISGIPAFKPFDISEMGTLLRISKIRQYNDDECIIAEGESDAWLYVLISGKVRIEKKGVAIGFIEEVGELFGEMRIIDRQLRSASVYSVGKTICLSLDTSASHRAYTKRDIPHIIGLLYKFIGTSLCKRLRRMNEELAETRKENVSLKKKLSEKPCDDLN